MWTSRTVVRSTRSRTTSLSARRHLSDGGRSTSGRGSGAFERFRQASRKNKKPREPSFAEKFLDPAARGELKKHQSGIPKLAARKHKSKTAIHDQFPGREAQEVLLDEQPYDEFEEALDEPYRVAAAAAGGDYSQQQEDEVDTHKDLHEEFKKSIKAQLPEGSEYVEDADEDDDGYEVVKMDTSFLTRGPKTDIKQYLKQNYFDGEFDPEEGYDDWEDTGFDPDNHPDIVREEDGTYVLHYDPEEEGYATDDDEEHEGGGAIEADNEPMVRQKPRDQNAPSFADVDLEERFFYPSVLDFGDPYPGPVQDEIVNQIRPLQERGPHIEDFLEATYQHPTKFAEVRRYNLHFESRREPKPVIPKTRKNPPNEWVKSYKKFLFVSGLPPNIFEEEADYDNPVHRNTIGTLIADLLEVEPDQVYPANMTSAFVGFKDRSVAPEIEENMRTEITMTSPIKISAYDGEDFGEFTKEFPECIVKLENLPPRMTPAKLAHDLFTPDSDLRLVYGQLDVKNILMISPTSALVRFDSAHHAESAATSEAVEVRLDELGNYPIGIFHAKRELIPDGFTGPNKGKELKRWGTRLIVDGDVPSDMFFRSHAGCIHMRNIDDTVTNHDIADVVQPYCANLRDVTGSVEWATNLQGDRTGTAFVGFDRLGEAEAFVKAVSGRIKGLGSSPVVVRTVGDKKIPGAKPREARPERTEEELLDDLNNWEKYVDPKEIEELEAMGINKKALDLAFRALRFQNSTYGAMDTALRSETLVPEKEAGEEYRETIREYIATIKECMGTPEDPGEIYESMFMPGEKIDLSIFDYEKRRQARIQKRLGG